MSSISNKWIFLYVYSNGCELFPIKILNTCKYSSVYKGTRKRTDALRDFWLFTDFISLCHFQLSRAPFQYKIIGYPQCVEAVAFLPKENRFPTEGLFSITRFWGGFILLPVFPLLLVLFINCEREWTQISFIYLDL